VAAGEQRYTHSPTAGSYGDGRAAEAIATAAREASGYIPQLLNPIDRDTDAVDRRRVFAGS